MGRGVLNKAYFKTEDNLNFYCIESHYKDQTNITMIDFAVLTNLKLVFITEEEYFKNTKENGI